MPTDHKPLPVAGYTPQPQEAIALVNELKTMEERYLRLLDKLVAANGTTHPAGTFDPRCLAEARTCIQTGAMWAVRSIFQPKRVGLPEDMASP